MATIKILSDPHIEFQPWQPVPTAADVLVLGNHDYWNHTDINCALDKAREETAGTHIHSLENDAVTLAGIRFLGCTLWTDYRLSGNQPLATYVPV